MSKWKTIQVRLDEETEKELNEIVEHNQAFADYFERKYSKADAIRNAIWYLYQIEITKNIEVKHNNEEFLKALKQSE